jgi:hypothetical protein
MASLGNIGFQFARPAVTSMGQFFTMNKQSTGVDMTGTSDTPYAFVSLFRNASLQYRSRADGSGVWHFYDMDDSLSQDYSITSCTQSGATGEAWVATVVGSVATVTKTFSSQRAHASAHP